MYGPFSPSMYDYMNQDILYFLPHNTDVFESHILQADGVINSMEQSPLE
jgi:hypothetical protein